MVRFQLYAGTRKSVALRLKWEHVHGDGAVLPDSQARCPHYLARVALPCHRRDTATASRCSRRPAAVAVNGGKGLHVVTRLLGDADIMTTFGYAYPAEGSVFDAANRMSQGLADILGGE